MVTNGNGNGNGKGNVYVSVREMTAEIPSVSEDISTNGAPCLIARWLMSTTQGTEVDGVRTLSRTARAYAADGSWINAGGTDASATAAGQNSGKLL